VSIDLSLEITRGGVHVDVPELVQASRINYSTQYPGGLYADLTFLLPTDPRISAPVQVGDFVQVWCDMQLAWEGYISAVTNAASVGAVGWNVECVGTWAVRMMARRVAKPWADTRVSDDAWFVRPTPYSANDKTMEKRVTFERQDRLEIKPLDGKAWANGDFVRLVYTAPTGSLVKRLAGNYQFNPGGQSWEMRVITGAANGVLQYTALGSGAFDVTFVTPDQTLFFDLISRAGQTVPADNTILAHLDLLTVYTETGAIDPQQICIDCAQIAQISTDTAGIGALTDALGHYIALPAMTLADIVTEVAAYGSSANAGWAAQIGKSTSASDELPRLELQPIPDVTAGADYMLWIDRPNCGEGVAFRQDVSEVVNYYHIQHTGADGIPYHFSPQDDATLQDSASITAYGRRDSDVITLNTTNLTLLKRYAKTKLAQTAPLRWKSSGDIPVTGWLDAAAGGALPVALVTAGTRLQIMNYLDDMTGSGGLVMLVTGTRYDHESRTVSISTGVPDTLEAWINRELRG